MMIQYQLQNNSKGETVAVTIVGQNISIPMNPDNSDYQAYLQWVSEGNVAQPAEVV